MPSKGKVLVAMSGGVDSSVAAALLMREGYEVVGVFMRLGSPGETVGELTPFDTAGVSCDPAKVKIGHQGCCSINDAADARGVAGGLGVPFYVCNFKKDFGRIIDYFVESYASGATPNPCVRCNDWLKFGKLHDYAHQIDAEFVASGHYARVENGRLKRGVDVSKDQSYVLFGASRERLTKMMLPIGGYQKSEVRAIAEELGLPVFDKPDSQEICFVPDNDYAGLVERRRPELAAKGSILDEAGNVVGAHDGQHRFTIGQRRGVGVALGYPIYVVDKNPATNTITVGDGEGLFSSACSVGEANWLTDASKYRDWTPAWVQHRYNSPAVRAEVRTDGVMPEGEASPSGRLGVFQVRFEEKQRAVAPGQALVIYDDDDPDVVVGGGWIRSASR